MRNRNCLIDTECCCGQTTGNKDGFMNSAYLIKRFGIYRNSDGGDDLPVSCLMPGNSSKMRQSHDLGHRKALEYLTKVD